MSQKNAYTIIREHFPAASDEEAEDMLWNRTGFPCFFKEDAEKEIKQSIAQLKATLDAGHKPCETCNDRAVIIDKTGSSCRRCFLAAGGKDYWFHWIKSAFYNLTFRRKRV